MCHWWGSGVAGNVAIVRTTVAIDLGDGQSAIIDRADADLVAGFKWRPLALEHTTYAHAWHRNLHLYLHRLIAGAGPEEKVDHANRNGLDNRRVNLRIATNSENGANRVPDNRRAGRTSRFKGVSWSTTREKWQAYIHYQGKTRYLGRFAEEEAAARAYDAAAVEAWGEFARLNLPEEVVPPCA